MDDRDRTLPPFTISTKNINIAYSNTIIIQSMYILESVDHNYFHVGPPSLDSGCGGRTVLDVVGGMVVGGMVVGGMVPEGTTSDVYTTTCAKSIVN